MKPVPPIVFVVDDDESVRRSLARLLTSAGLAVQVFASAQEFIDASADVPGCLLLDIKMPKITGLDLQSELTKIGVNLPVIFLTGHGDVASAVRAMKGGAVDFLAKPFRSRDLLAAVRAAIEKDSQRRQGDAEKAVIQRLAASLTPREVAVFRMVVSGAPNKQIAGDLGIAERTVKVHRARVMQKMQVSSIAELSRLAERGALDSLDCPKVVHTQIPAVAMSKASGQAVGSAKANTACRKPA